MGQVESPLHSDPGHETESTGLDQGVWVSIAGDRLDLDDVAQLFSRSTGVRIRREADTYFITAPDMALLATDAEKRDRAIELIELVNGAARLQWTNHRTLTAGSRVVTIEADGSRREGIVVQVGAAESRSRAGSVTVVIGGVPVPTPPPAPPRWVEAALTDRDVAAALRILADPDVAWSRLYHVFEIVQSDVGSGMDQWATPAARDLFTWTANNRPAIGDEARHGHSRFQSPPSPMTLGEARKLIRSIVAGWLTDRIP